MRVQRSLAALTVVVAVFAPTASFAETVTLVCERSDGQPPFPLELNEAAGTVNGKSARFEADRITWQDRAYGVPSSYELNRITGAYTAGGFDDTINWQVRAICRPGKRQF